MCGRDSLPGLRKVPLDRGAGYQHPMSLGGGGVELVAVVCHQNLTCFVAEILVAPRSMTHFTGASRSTTISLIFGETEVICMRQTQLVTQVSPELKEAAERLAAAERRSLSGWLRNIVADRIEAAKSQQAA
jgi:hypothetical protein